MTVIQGVLTSDYRITDSLTNNEYYSARNGERYILGQAKFTGKRV